MLTPRVISSCYRQADVTVNLWVRGQLQAEREYRRPVFERQSDHLDAVYDSLSTMLDLMNSHLDFHVDIFSVESEGMSMFRCHRMMGSLSCFPC